MLLNDERNWDAIGDYRPDGSYALCRWPDDVVQIVTDATGSRSLWYAVTEAKFAVCSSIGIIVELLGQFIFDERVIPWMIATGSLGEYFWDKRIKRCPADSVLSFDRRTWSDSIESRSVEFVESPTCLDHLLNHRFAHLQLPEGSIVTLSGGVDSRAILAAMPDLAAVPSITWGAADGAHDPQNDVAVVKRVAQQLSSPHRFLPLEQSEVTIAEIVERFIDVPEGRIDHLAGYADGLALWEMLYKTGVRRIIRGDEGFGWNVGFNETQARRGLGFLRISDYFSQEQREQFALEEVMWPESYHWRPTETLATWRDRLYHEFRIPTVLASLNDIKAVMWR